mmetsp:Transcript_98408/g.278297  ORF Transcript_98408/g.278297 Transcript_98408/m.278297 type:complete len:170 (+) Transcript_98408:1887-2396(+)
MPEPACQSIGGLDSQWFEYEPQSPRIESMAAKETTTSAGSAYCLELCYLAVGPSPCAGERGEEFCVASFWEPAAVGTEPVTVACVHKSVARNEATWRRDSSDTRGHQNGAIGRKFLCVFAAGWHAIELLVHQQRWRNGCCHSHRRGWRRKLAVRGAPQTWQPRPAQQPR